MYKVENQNLKYAKPSYEHIRNFGKGDLQVSGSTIDFLLSLSSHVDLDGKVNIPLEYICSKQDIQRGTFKRIIAETLANGLMVRKGEEYYSNFHILTDGNDRNRTYIKPLEVFTSAQIRNCSLREKRLFYYFATVTRLGQWQSINIENLYRNSIYKDDKNMDKRVCIDYFHSFREVSNVLIKLVKLGLLEIELTQFNEERMPCSAKQKIYLKSDDDSIEEQYNSYFDFLKDQRKHRSSKSLSQKRVVRVRVAPYHTKQTVQIEASKSEFIYLANSHHIAWDKLKRKTINYFIGIKNDLYRVSGELGLAIYRTSLRRYMKEEGMNMLYFDVNDKNANYFMDYYVLEEIKSILLESVHQQKYMSNSMTSEEGKLSWSIITRSNYRLSEENLGALLIYYEKKASINHKVNLDAEMYKKDIRSSDILLNKAEWATILKGISNEYYHYKSQFEGASVIFSALQEPVDEHEWRLLMHEVAEQELFLKKDAFKEKMKQLRKRIEGQQARPKVAFYNWLIERE